MKITLPLTRPFRRLALTLFISVLCIAFLLSSNLSPTASSDESKTSRQHKTAESLAKEGDVPEQLFETITLPPGSLPPKQIGKGSARNVATGINLGQEDEPNNTSATATPITSASARIRGTVFPPADVDFYSFTATMGDRIYAATQTLFDASASGDSVLDILNTDGVTVLETDNNDGSFNASSSSIAGFLIPANGTYFLRVRHNVATGSIRPYDLYFNRQTGAPVAEVESNNTPATANPLPASGWASGTITAVSPGESDFFSLTLAAGDTVYLSLDMNPERDANVWNGRLGFGLFGNPPANQILLVNDANAGAAPADPNSEAFFFTVKDPGTYFVYIDSIVAAGLGANATYNLSVAVHPASTTGTCTTYTSTDVPVVIPTGPGIAMSTITVPGNPRIADLNVQINLNHTFMQDLDVHLVSPAGNDNGLFTDIGAATVGGPQTLMDLIIDDQAGLPPAFAMSASFIIQPELAYRLGWFNGENGGGTWTLVMRDDATGDGGTLNSWSITICEPPPAPTCGSGFTQTTVFSTDFESGDAGFTHSGAQDEWELGLPTAVPITTCNSGVNCWKTDLDNTYNASSSQDLVSPNINLAGLSGPVTLSWAQRYHIESANFDHYSVDVREVGNPSNSQRVFEWLDATMNNTVGNPAVTIAESSGWSVLTADISAFAGLNIEIVFHLDSDTTVQLGGVAIDDVSVTACMEAACMITCPANVTQDNDLNQCGAVVNYPAPTDNGNCDMVTCSPPAGSFFPVGTTTVTCQNTGGMPSCTFDVTVVDAQPPAITCPANITASNDPNQCGAVVTYPAPTITDNCPGTFTATCTPPSGSFFPVGTTTVTCTIDGSNGARPNGACMTETITHSTSQAITPLNSKSCNDGSGHADNSYYRAFNLPTFGVSGNFQIESVSIGVEVAIAGGMTQTGGGKGGATTPPPTGKNGKQPSQLSGRSGAVRPTGGGSQPLTVNLYTSSMAFPAGFPGSLTLIGTTSIMVADQSETILTIPIAATAPAGSELVVEVFTPDGTAAGNHFFIGANTAAETGPSYLRAPDCGITTPMPTAAIGLSGMNIVMNVTGCDVAVGGGASCTFDVTVNDAQPPTITCPTNVTAITPPPASTSVCTAPTNVVVTYAAPTAGDSCPGVTVACVPPSGSAFPVGSTTVTCTATDAAGNTATCSFTVAVFNAWLQDIANPNTVLLFNTQTGDYRFCCNGTVYTGVGTVAMRGCVYTLTHNATDRRVRGEIDFAIARGNGSVQSPAGKTLCTLSDSNIRNNTNLCGAPVPLAAGK